MYVDCDSVRGFIRITKKKNLYTIFCMLDRCYKPVSSNSALAFLRQQKTVKIDINGNMYMLNLTITAISMQMHRLTFATLVFQLLPTR